MESPSAWHCSAAIRQQLYQILSVSSINYIPVIKEYDREKKKLVTRSVKVEDNEEIKCLTLHNLYKQSEEERLCLFYDTLGITSDMIAAGVVDPRSPDRRDNDILTAIVIHWSNHSQPQIYKM